MIAVIDYGIGNLRSVQKAVQRTGFGCIITREPSELARADKLILPGVGNFERGIDNLRKYNLTETLSELVLLQKKEILGICLGMQLMTDFSEEGNCAGLSWISGSTKLFMLEKLKVPHIGWNSLEVVSKGKFDVELSSEDELYFVHSYYVVCDNREDVLFRSNYEIDFVSGFQKENITGVQFHPEKSHEAGLKILKWFLLK